MRHSCERHRSEMRVSSRRNAHFGLLRRQCLCKTSVSSRRNAHFCKTDAEQNVPPRPSAGRPKSGPKRGPQNTLLGGSKTGVSLDTVANFQLAGTAAFRAKRAFRVGETLFFAKPMSSSRESNGSKIIILINEADDSGHPGIVGCEAEKSSS